MVRRGFYKHFKGGNYEVIGEALHSETKEPMIVYRSIDYGTLWVRSEAMFEETVERDGYKGPRFTFVRGPEK